VKESSSSSSRRLLISLWVTSPLFLCPELTDAPYHYYRGSVPPSPIWRPHPQGPHTLPSQGTRQLQHSQHFSLAISFRNQQFFSKFSFLLEVSRELPQRSTLNTFFVALSFLVVYLQSLTLFALTFLCVSHSNLLIFVLSQTCHTFVSSSILLPYSGFQFLFFVGRVSNKPLDFTNFF
jgi:hypothetical protein